LDPQQNKRCSIGSEIGTFLGSFVGPEKVTWLRVENGKNLKLEYNRDSDSVNTKNHHVDLNKPIQREEPGALSKDKCKLTLIMRKFRLHPLIHTSPSGALAQHFEVEK
jgi:hypothetical protein